MPTNPVSKYDIATKITVTANITTSNETIFESTTGNYGKVLSWTVVENDINCQWLALEATLMDNTVYYEQFFCINRERTFTYNQDIKKFKFKRYLPADATGTIKVIIGYGRWAEIEQSKILLGHGSFYHNIVFTPYYEGITRCTLFRYKGQDDGNDMICHCHMFVTNRLGVTYRTDEEIENGKMHETKYGDCRALRYVTCRHVY